MTITRPLAAEAVPRDRWRDVVIALVLAEIVIVAFAPAFRAGFVLWDDDHYFLGNPHYRGLGPSQLSWMFTVMWGHYMPLTWLSHGLDYVLWGMHPAGYHAFNVLLHAVATGAAYFVALRLLDAAVAPVSRLALRFAAAVAALLFAVHPLRVESVVWITERRDVLCGVFFLGAVLCYLRAVDADAPQRTRWYRWAVAFGGLALLSKAMAVTLPAVLLLLDVYPLRRLGPGRWTRREVWREKLPFAALSVVAAVLAIAAQRSVGTLSDLRAVGILERVGLACYGLVFYVWKTLFPTRLSPLYEAPHDFATLTPWFLASALVVAAMAAGLIAGRHRWPGLAAAGAGFVVLLLPVLGLLHFGLHIAADRNTYFAGLAAAMLAGGVVLSMLGAGRSVVVARCTVATALTVVLVLSVLTWRQSLVWRDSRTLWAHALAVSPSSVAHAKLGVLRDEEGRTEEAIAHFREALRLRPDNAYAENNWGVALANVWRFSEAIARFEAALRIQPGYADARRNLQLTRVRMANPLGYLDAHRAGREDAARGAAVGRITPTGR